MARLERRAGIGDPVETVARRWLGWSMPLVVLLLSAIVLGKGMGGTRTAAATTQAPVKPQVTTVQSPTDPKATTATAAPQVTQAPGTVGRDDGQQPLTQAKPAAMTLPARQVYVSDPYGEFGYGRLFDPHNPPTRMNSWPCGKSFKVDAVIGDPVTGAYQIQTNPDIFVPISGVMEWDGVSPIPACPVPDVCMGLSDNRLVGCLVVVEFYGHEAWSQWPCIDRLDFRESGWRVDATNPKSYAYGLPQSLPGKKMSAAGSDWRTNPWTQMRWQVEMYLPGRTYTTPCAADAYQAANGGY